MTSLPYFQPLYKLLAEVEEKLRTQAEAEATLRPAGYDGADYWESTQRSQDQDQQRRQSRALQHSDAQDEQKRSAWSWRTRTCNDSALPGPAAPAGPAAAAAPAGPASEVRIGDGCVVRPRKFESQRSSVRSWFWFVRSRRRSARSGLGGPGRMACSPMNAL